MDSAGKTALSRSGLEDRLDAPSPMETPRKKRRRKIREKVFSVGRERKFVRILPKYPKHVGCSDQDSSLVLQNVDEVIGIIRSAPIEAISTNPFAAEETAAGSHCSSGGGGGVPRSFSSVTRIVARESGVDAGGELRLKRHRSEGETLTGNKTTKKKTVLTALDSRERRLLYNTFVKESARIARDSEPNGNSVFHRDPRYSRNEDKSRLLGRRRCLGFGYDAAPEVLGSSSKSSSLMQFPIEEEEHEAPPPPPPPTALSRWKRCLDCWKRFLAFLFSTIGLLCLMIGYVILGGLIFMALEAPNEATIKNDVQRSLKFHVEWLWNVTEEMNVLHPDNWTTAAEVVLDEFKREVYRATKISGWDGTDGEKELQWSFAGALLYSVTVITTIGYGHIAPKTPQGQVVTMLYAIIGIPLTLLAITNLGGFMATAFRYIYKTVCQSLCSCACCCPPSSSSSRRSAAAGTVVLANRMVSQQTTSKLATGERSISQTTTVDAEKSSASIQQQTTNCIGIIPAQYDVEVKWRSGLNRSLQTEDNKSVSVPIYVSLLLIVGYIAIGAVLFSAWEDWSLLVGSYFCFITLSTIGFGDYVPGTSVDAWNSQEKLILCALYLIVGLALLAMCFDLMQEETRRKFRVLGQKLGILDRKT